MFEVLFFFAIFVKKMASDKINSLIDVKTVEKEIASTVDSLDKILQKMTAITAQAAKSGFIKNAKDIEQLTKASEELNAITEEQIALDKEVKKQKDALAAATAKLAALQTEEAKALEEARQKTAEATRELKNRVAAERAAEGSIAKMRGELNALTAQYDKLSQEERENISVGGKMQSQIKGLSDALKQLEHQTGRDQRNVGNYAEAVNTVNMSLGEMKRELRSLRNMKFDGLNPEQIEKVRARMAELTDEIGDFQSQINTAATDKLPALMAGLQGLVSVAQLTTGTLSMFGIENDKLEKSMVQLIGVSQALAQIQDMGQKKTLQVAWAHVKDTYAKIANTVATYANARANEASTKVMSGLWKVIAANPMTALVLGIAAVTAGLIALVNALRPAKSTLESLAESQKTVFDSAWETVGSLEAYRSIITDTTRTEKERTAAMNAYNKIAKEQGLATVSLTMSTAELNAAMDENLKRVYASAAATAAMNEMTAKFAELIKLRAIQQKYADENIGLRSSIQQKIDETNKEIKSLQALYVITTSYTEGVKQGTDKVNLLVKGMEKINEETKKDTDNTTKASKARRKMNEDLKLHMETINSASDELKKLADEEASYVAKATKRQTELTNNTLGDLKKMLQEGTITADEYETKVSELAQARLDMERYNFRELKRMRDEDMISEEQYLKARNEALMAYGDAAMGVLTAGFQFADSLQEAELSKYKEAQDKKLESLQNALNNNIISQQSYDVQKAAIEKETEKREKIMARNKAKREKADALFSIGISTSKAIMAIWADLTLSTIAKGIFTALVAAQGALQAGAVAAKPLPAYEKGGTVRETGLALVSEKGSELVDTGAGMFITPSIPTIMPLQAGWKVTPSDKTAQMLNSGEIVTKLDAVERAITNKREFGINVTEQGFYVVAKRGNSRQTYINKKFKN